jgi:hypothetical protein
MQFCVTRVILRDLAALVPQIFHSLHKITHFLTGYINSYLTLVIFYLFINVKVALFAAFSISAGNMSSISASLTSFSLHSMFTNAIMWN